MVSMETKTYQPEDVCKDARDKPPRVGRQASVICIVAEPVGESARDGNDKWDRQSSACRCLS
jgi:hypothetical protein